MPAHTLTRKFCLHKASDCTHCNIPVVKERKGSYFVSCSRVECCISALGFVRLLALGCMLFLRVESKPVSEGRGALPALLFTKQLCLGKCSSL